MSRKTTLSPEKLAELAAQGLALAARSRFVNPDTAAASMRLLRTRGEEWTARVLMRRLDRRSLALPAYPWLEDGEMETLILADQAEWAQLAEAAGGSPR